jgi:TP901 family phage tail tape measure protein
MAATRTRKINIYVNGVEVQNNIRAIGKAIRDLENRTRLLDRTSMEYVNNMKKIRELKGIIYEHNQALNVTNHNLFTLKGLANAFNKYWPVIMGTIGSIAGLVFSVKAVTDEFAQFDDKLTDIMKTTGLTREEVVALDADLQKINTRTARTELLDLAYVAGKLGITSRQEILEFVRASDKIVVAIQKDLGGSAEDAINTLGKLVQVFKLREEYGMEEAMLKVGSAINSLGMASSANEENIVSFSKRVAGIGKLADIQVPDILGLGATIDALAISTEVGSTAYSMFMGRMTQDTATFATIAGMKLDDFVTLLNEDANEAFIRVLEALNHTGEGFTALRGSMEAAGLDGERAVAVMSTLSQQTDFLRQQQDLSTKAFILGTSVIDEFNIKNNSAQAIIEKNEKKLAAVRVELGEKLLPVYASGQSVLVKFIQTISVLTGFLINNAKGISAVVISLMAYKTAAAIASIWQDRLIAGTIGHKIATYAQLVADRAWIATVGIKITLTKLFTREIGLATAATRIFNLVLSGSGIGAVVAVLAGIVSYIGMYAISMRNASRETINLADEIARLTNERRKNLLEEATNTKTLLTIINGLNEKSSLRVGLINKLKQAYPEMLSYIDAETVSTAELNTAMSGVNENIRQRIDLATEEAKSEAYKNKMIEVQGRLLDKQMEIEKEKRDYLNLESQRRPSMKEEQWHREAMNRLEKDYNSIKAESLDLENALLSAHEVALAKKRQMDQQLTQEYIRQIGVLQQQREDALKMKVVDKARISSIDVEIGRLNKKISTIKNVAAAEDQYSELKEQEAKYKELKRYNAGEVNKFTHEQNMRKIELQFMQGRFDNYELEALKRAELANDIEKKKAEIMEAYDKQNDQRENYKLKKDFEFQQKAIQLKKDYLAGLIASEKDYQDKLLQLEIDSITERLAKEEVGSKEYIALDAQLQDKLIEQLTRRLTYEAALRDAAGVDEIQQVRDKYTKQLQDLGIYGMRVEQMTTEQQKAFAGIMVNAQTELNQIDAENVKAFFNEKLQNYDLELAMLKDKHAKELTQEGLTNAERRRLRIAHNKELVKFTTDQMNVLIALADQLQKGAKLDGLMLSDDLFSDEEKQQALAFLTVFYEELAKLKSKTDEFGIAMKDAFGISISDWDKFIKNIGKGWDELKWGTKFETIAVGLMAISNLAEQYYQLMEKYDQRRIERLTNQYDEEKAAIAKKLEFGLISQENYNAQVAKMDKELNYKKALLAREQARREKEIAIFQATIQGAVAVVLTLANPILAAIVAAAVVSQIAMIAATPLPDLPGAETGGMLVQRSQDGKRFNATYNPQKRGYVSSPTVLVGENGMEYVVPAAAMSNPTISPVLNALEMARLSNNLASVNFNDLLFRQIYNSRQAGGYTSVSAPSAQASVKTSATSASNDQLIHLLTENYRMLAELNKKIDKPFRGIVALHGDNGLYKALQDDQTITENANL